MGRWTPRAWRSGVPAGEPCCPRCHAVIDARRLPACPECGREASVARDEPRGAWLLHTLATSQLLLMAGLAFCVVHELAAGRAARWHAQRASVFVDAVGGSVTLAVAVAVLVGVFVASRRMRCTISASARVTFRRLSISLVLSLYVLIVLFCTFTIKYGYLWRTLF